MRRNGSSQSVPDAIRSATVAARADGALAFAVRLDCADTNALQAASANAHKTNFLAVLAFDSLLLIEVDFPKNPKDMGGRLTDRESDSA